MNCKPMGRTEQTNINTAKRKLRVPKISDEIGISQNFYSQEEENDVPQHIRNNYIFRLEYDYWRQQGQAHIVCYRKAIDYYRKNTRREVTENYKQKIDEIAYDNSAEDIIEKINFNQNIARAFLEVDSEIERELLAYIIIQQEVFQYLDDRMLAVVEKYTKGNHPENAKEIAECMGFKLNSIGVSTKLYNTRKKIAAIFSNIGFTLESLKES